MLFGGVYLNQDGHLPHKPGRIWYEADLNYYSGRRNGHRIYWSNDGLIFVTYNHGQTYYEIIQEGKIVEERTIIKLDLTGCKSSFDIQNKIQEAFGFPDWYGKIWDAFWDLLYPTRDNTIIEITGISTLPDKTKKYIDILLGMLQENKDKMDQLKQQKPEFDCRVDYQIID
jgi:RNAse (barnase) inhibitor barstar